MVEIPKDDIQQLYASLMSEVKARLASVEAGLRDLPKFKGNQVQQGFVLEYCYMHLRRITELVAVAVLAAHNPIPMFREKSFVKEWNPDALFKKLAGLNPEAFPQPVHHFDEGSNELVGDYVQVLMPSNPSFEVRDEICRIYNECGDKLHTGHLKAILRDRNKAYSVVFVREAFTNLYKYLHQHVTTLPDGRLMQAKLHLNKPGPVHARWLGREPQPPPAKRDTAAE
jgi:hypothetical protein